MSAIDKERFNLAIYKSINSLKEMIKLRYEYRKLSNDPFFDRVENSEEFKRRLDKILKRSFYNIDTYCFEIEVLLDFLEKDVLLKDDFLDLK